ncbi:MAG: LysR family transcriptional regulator [Clostridiaceae bacterium]|jgi:DNA-binding transcriptional LysR family regulator|nr:LysR family transcriptional regulator [Clostridiaceae bacterium]
MTLRHLRIFVAVCKYGSATAAGKHLYLAQPAVSLAISELESNYGIKLFDRISNRLHITDQGRQFLDYAMHIISLFDEMEESMKDWEYIGTLRIGSSITIGTHLLPEYIKAFKQKYPKIKLKVKIDNSAEIEKAIGENEFDIGLIEGKVQHPQIIAERYLDDRLALICGKTHPLYRKEKVSIEELQKYDFIMREKGSGGRDLFDSTMLINNIELDYIGDSVSTQAIIKAVEAGLGISALPYLMVKEPLDASELWEIKVKGISLSRGFYIIYHKNKYLSQSTTDFISICKNHSH